MRLALCVGAIAVCAVVCLFGEADAQQVPQFAANLDAAGAPAQKSLPIKFHTVAGLKRIDLIDEDADDETYRAFQLARYTGDAMMQVRAHEEEFRRRMREEASELGETKSSPQDAQLHNDEQSEKWNAKHDDAEKARRAKRSSRFSEIMGDHEELLQVGEDREAEIMGDDYEHPDLGEDSSVENNRLGETAGVMTREPFDAVHVSQSGDIEDDDQHFVMTDKLRHEELKNAVMMKSESPTEHKAQKLAKKMLFMQQKIRQFQQKQENKDRLDLADLTAKKDAAEGLKRHHLMLDDQGRVVPDF